MHMKLDCPHCSKEVVVKSFLFREKFDGYMKFDIVGFGKTKEEAFECAKQKLRTLSVDPDKMYLEKISEFKH